MVSSSMYLKTTGQTTNETGQLFVGQQQGLVMMTRTAHALRFKTYSDEVGVTVPNSMQILGTGTRYVEILAPLNIKSNIEAVANLTVGGTSNLAGVTCTTLTASSNATVSGNLNVTGTLSTNSFFVNKPWASCLVTTTAGVVSLTNYGFLHFNSCECNKSWDE